MYSDQQQQNHQRLLSSNEAPTTTTEPQETTSTTNSLPKAPASISTTYFIQKHQKQYLQLNHQQQHL